MQPSGNLNGGGGLKKPNNQQPQPSIFAGIDQSKVSMIQHRVKTDHYVLPDDSAVAFYEKQIEKLRNENRTLQATIRELDLSKQVAYTTSEADVTSQFSHSIQASLKKLGLSEMIGIG